MATRTTRYTRRPTVPATELARTRVLLSVLQGQRTLTAAARELRLSRVQVQTLLHRGLTGFLEALARKPAGRPRRPATEAALRGDNARLRREAARWQRRARTTERVLEVASGLLTGRVPMRGRATISMPVSSRLTSFPFTPSSPRRPRRTRSSRARTRP
jgi:hypothetical protein